MRERKLDKYMDAIWGDFDKADSVDIILLCFGYFWLAVLLGMGIMDMVYYVKG
tara:strand:- start:784 stop:942 length:159 start_codon:yes stop_codon:yes gene_type:complete